MPSLAYRVAALLFASGFCALAYQIAWLRLLRSIFGASTAASAAVLAIFMGGLGIGGIVLGRLADRNRRPLGLYAGLETGVALTAGLTPLLIAAVRWLYLGLGGTQALGTVGGTAVRLVLAAAVLGVPTVLMGGTLPAAVRAVTGVADLGRRGLGLLYALNALGGVVGIAVTAFFALELLGIRRTIWIAALLNLLVAVTARAMARAAPPVPPEPAAVRRPTPEGGARRTGERGSVLLVLGAAGAVGFAFLLMELVWYRMLAPILGGTSYTFALVLAVALAGIGAGGLLYAIGPADRRPTLFGFALTAAAEAVLLALPLALGDRVAFLALSLQSLGDAGFPGLVLGWTVVAGIVVFPAALVAGYQFPLLVGILGSGRRRVGREVGLAYGWNTGGAIAGSIAGGFGLLPLLSAPGTWRLTALLLAGLSLAAWGVDLRSRAGAQRPRAAAAVTLPVLLVVLLCLAPGPTAFWRHSGIGTHRAPSDFDGPNDLRSFVRSERWRPVWEAEGRESSVALVHGFGYTFLINGKVDGSALGDAPTQVMGGLVGTMLHPAPESALVIGLGTGSTAGWMAQVPGMKRVDVVELEPAIARVAEDCAPVNRRALERENLELIVGDGREYLLTTDRRYDVVFSEPSNPDRAGISSLFTREFYGATADRLEPGGLFLQWLQGYQVDAGVVATAYATLASVFPVVETWRTQRGDLLLVAALGPVGHDWERAARRAAAEPYRSALALAWGVEGADGFYSGFLAGPELARRIAASPRSPVNTDDHPVIEFGFVRNLGRRGLFEIDELAALARLHGEDRPSFPGGSPGWERVTDARSARGVFLGHPVPLPAGADPWLRSRAAARADYVGRQIETVAARWEEQPEPPRHPADLLVVAAARAAIGAVEAPRSLQRLATRLPADALALEALHRARSGDPGGAEARLVALFELLRRRPWIRPEVFDQAMALAEELGRGSPERAGRLFDALGRPFAVAVGERGRLSVRLRLAELSGLDARCVEAFAGFEPHVPWEEEVLASRVRCYRRLGHPLLDRARSELARWRSADAPGLADLVGSERSGEAR